jgi:hypothetical protein
MYFLPESPRIMLATIYIDFASVQLFFRKPYSRGFICLQPRQPLLYL